MRCIRTRRDFDESLSVNHGKLVVVDFFRDGCPACKEMSPFLEFLSQDHTYRNIVFQKVNVDVNQETATACSVTLLPTFKFYKSKREVDQLEGADQKQLVAKIQKHM
ncbi:thioredoxin-like [Haliotis cracherodii]|uniref:thioredoxin-like n=1 Tax=Haliotis rufescens TaxID=6454 RepID=UPI001EB08B58|nr:thioredoxin-like [Haliotis rufescens]